jgi:hypothetical protein
MNSMSCAGIGLAFEDGMTRRLALIIRLSLLALAIAAAAGCDPDTTPTICIALPSAC